MPAKTLLFPFLAAFAWMTAPTHAVETADFQNPPVKLKTKPLWFWNNTTVTGSGLIDQIQLGRDESQYGGYSILPFGGGFRPGYAKRVQGWCNAHGGISATGHQDQVEVVNPCNVSGDLMKCARGQAIPGIDSPPLSPPLGPAQRMLQGLSSKSKFPAVAGVRNLREGCGRRSTIPMCTPSSSQVS